MWAANIRVRRLVVMGRLGRNSSRVGVISALNTRTCSHNNNKIIIIL